MFFKNFTRNVSYFPLYFSNLERAIFNEQYLFMTFSGYSITQNLLNIGQEVVSTDPF